MDGEGGREGGEEDGTEGNLEAAPALPVSSPPSSTAAPTPPSSSFCVMEMEEEGQIDFKIGFSSHPGAQVAKLDVRFQVDAPSLPPSVPPSFPRPPRIKSRCLSSSFSITPSSNLSQSSR